MTMHDPGRTQTSVTPPSESTVLLLAGAPSSGSGALSAAGAVPGDPCVWALADPHLGFALDKPMDVFGSRWGRHEARIREAWTAKVAPHDLVLLPGDISWAIDWEQVRPDLEFLHKLPGRKIIGRGNHDYWWDSLRKAESFCKEQGFDSLRFVRNTAIRLPGLVICGCRGWTAPGTNGYNAEDKRLFERECIRVDLSLQAAAKCREPGDKLILMLHYPPFSQKCHENAMLDRILGADVDLCVFGHVHGKRGEAMRHTVIGDLSFLNCACDVLKFSPVNLLPYLEKGNENRTYGDAAT